jgi:hypothetical protein
MKVGNLSEAQTLSTAKEARLNDKSHRLDRLGLILTPPNCSFGESMAVFGLAWSIFQAWCLALCHVLSARSAFYDMTGARRLFLVLCLDFFYFDYCFND